MPGNKRVAKAGSGSRKAGSVAEGPKKRPAPLTDVSLRKARPQATGYRIPDSHGLSLFVTPAGMKSWRYRYRWLGREQTLVIGAYPDIGLSAAREARDQAREALRRGEDPAALKRDTRSEAERHAAETFEVLAREWHEMHRQTWSTKHAKDVLDSLEDRVFPFIGALPVRQIPSSEIVKVIRRIEATAIETAHRVRQRISSVFVFALATDRAERDPAAPVKGALAPVIRKRQVAVTDLDAAREMLQAVDRTPSAAATKLVMRLLALTVVRPGTMVATPWNEFEDLDPERPTWRIPAERMKLKIRHKSDETRDHLVPLAPQAIEIIEVLRKVTGRSRFILPNARFLQRPASANALGYLMNRAGYTNRHVPHGWRTTFSTVMNERFRPDRAVIDLMLAHVPDSGPSDSEAAYNRSAHIERRRELARIWADLITEGLRPPRDLLALPYRVNTLSTRSAPRETDA